MLLHDPLFIIVAIACLAVLFILVLGIGSFGKGGAFNQRNANKLMRYRIYAQAVAIALILLFVFIRRGGWN